MAWKIGVQPLTPAAQVFGLTPSAASDRIAATSPVRDAAMSAPHSGVGGGTERAHAAASAAAATRGMCLEAIACSLLRAA
jgi:hypothetical protein